MPYYLKPHDNSLNHVCCLPHVTDGKTKGLSNLPKVIQLMSRETGLEQRDLEHRRDLLEGPGAYGAVPLWIHTPLTLIASLPLGVSICIILALSQS